MSGSTKTLERSGASCVLIGSESLAIQCAEILLEKGLDLRAVVSAEPRITAWASAHCIATFAPGMDLAQRLRAIDHDYFLSITNLTMIGEEILALPRKAAINFHDGPLPRYAGMYTPAWALLDGATDYGITFHEMTLGADVPNEWFMIGQLPGRTTPASDALRMRRGPTATPIQAGDGTTTLTRFVPG